MTSELAVALACYNRREKTLACIASLYAQTGDGVGVMQSMRVILVDDGSTDGTAEAVATRFPEVEIIRGNGSLFWCRAMHMAQAAAMQSGCRYLLWLNDDTELAPDSLSRLLRTEQWSRNTTGMPAVVVGSLSDPDTGQTTYGGMVRAHWWQRTNLKIATPGNEPLSAVSMNGNCVLIPREVLDSVGNFDPQFEHAMGDMDYGFRVVRAGFPIWIMPGYVGMCKRNPSRGTYVDRTLSLPQRWRHILSPKGLPPHSLYVFARRHAGPLWPFYWAWPYVRVVLSAAIHGRLYR